MVSGNRLVDQEEAGDYDIPLFIRSVWWHFRLKRYGNRLCLEIRPFARRSDEHIREQWLALYSILKEF